MIDGLSTREGSCFGFGIRSELPMNYLRDGSGALLEIHLAESAPRIRSAQQIVEWIPTPQRPLRARLYHDGGRYSLWIDDGGWFVIDADGGRIEVPPDVDPLRREERLWGLPTALCFLARGDRSLHASAVEVHGQAILLAGPSRHGKTTLAAGFLGNGFRVLTEDVSCYRITNLPVLFPGPSMLRVRRDVADRMTLPNARLIAEDQDRSHFVLDAAMRGDSSPIPIGGIIFLKDHGDQIEFERVSVLSALPDLWLLSLHLPTNEDRAEAFEAISALADKVPAWNLVRPTTIGALPDVVHAITKLVERSKSDRESVALTKSPTSGVASFLD